MDDLAFRADDDGSSIAQLTRTVDIREIALVHDGIGLGNDQFLWPVDGSRHGRMDHDLRAHPCQGASRLWNPTVIANGNSKAANPGNIEGDEFSSAFHSFFIWQEGIHLAVSRDYLALGTDDRRGVEYVFSNPLID